MCAHSFLIHCIRGMPVTHLQEELLEPSLLFQKIEMFFYEQKIYQGIKNDDIWYSFSWKNV